MSSEQHEMTRMKPLGPLEGLEQCHEMRGLWFPCLPPTPDNVNVRDKGEAREATKCPQSRREVTPGWLAVEDLMPLEAESWAWVKDRI